MERTAQQLYRENLIQRFNDPDLQDFVQSTINILSDGIDIDDINGLKLESKGGNKKLISFYEKIKNKSSLWDISLGQTEQKHNSLNIAANDKNKVIYYMVKGIYLMLITFGETSPDLLVSFANLARIYQMNK